MSDKEALREAVLYLTSTVYQRCPSCYHHFTTQGAGVSEPTLRELKRKAWDVPADPALDRASIPAMFNVVGDKLRKLSERMASGVIQQSHQAQINKLRIESQLTALRAEADKGRERITDSLDLVGAEEFTQIKCLLDLTNKRLKALELRDARGKKKQERKRGKR